MADAAKLDVDEAPPPKKGKKGLLIGLVAMLLLGGGGFFATFSGMLALPFGGDGAESGREEAAHEEEAGPDDPDPVFVAIDPMTVTLGPTARARHLKILVQLEVAPGTEAEVENLMPRVKDVINSYLQALDEADIDRPAAMTRMRSHLLRRMKIVLGEEGVRDLLITEFILQ